MGNTNVRDIGFKMLWTAVAAGLGYLATVLVDIDAGWVPVAAAAVNAATAWVRQQLGATPPTAPPAR
jgi:hypothetical protein